MMMTRAVERVSRERKMVGYLVIVDYGKMSNSMMKAFINKDRRTES